MIRFLIFIAACLVLIAAYVRDQNSAHFPAVTASDFKGDPWAGWKDCGPNSDALKSC
jgi:hypothetical protein